MKEIGGYIELDTYTGAEYHQPQVALNCGRNALAYLFESRKISKLYIPYYLCDSVSGVCEKHGVPVEYYHIDHSFFPLFDGALGEHEYLYIVNYYGQITNQQITDWQQKYERIIVDNAQAFFQMPVAGVDTLYSCRKFFGVPDGAYLYTDSSINRELETDYSYDRMRFLLGRYEKEATEFYPEYVKNNQLFQSEPIKAMSKLTHNLLRGIDYEKVKNRRSKNFLCLHQALSDMNELPVSIPDGAFMYPFLVSDGAAAREELRGKKIYVPTLWPDVFDICKPDTLEYEYAMNILPLPVDQRYTSVDIDYIVKELLTWI